MNFLRIGIPRDEDHHEKKHHLGEYIMCLELFPFASASKSLKPMVIVFVPKDRVRKKC